MSDLRDYMIKVGMELATEDASKVKTAIEKAFKDIKPIEIKVNSGSSGISQVSRDLKQVSVEATSADRLMKQFYERLSGKGAAASAEAMVSAFGRAKDAAISAKQAEIQAENEITRAIEQKIRANEMFIAQQNLIRNQAARQQSDVSSLGSQFRSNTYDKFGGERLAEQQRRMGNSDIGRGWEENLKKLDPQLERSGAMWERYGAQVTKGAQAHQAMMNRLPEDVQRLKGVADEFAHMATTFLVWSASAKAIEGVTHGISKGFSDAVHMQKEQTITGMYYEAQGGDYTPAKSGKAQAEAINMARIYGEEVSHVTENIGLWAKVTNGQLNPAIALTNSAMKINAISGMNMEEIYRDTIAVMGQLQEPLSRVNDLYNVATGLALKYGGGIQSLGGESDDAVKQMMDGMTRLTAIMVEGLGKGKDTLAKIGAEVAIVSHLTNESGDAVAGHLSAAFAKIEAGKLHDNLKNIGIETRNNANLIEDLGKKWGQVMPILQAGGVRSQDLEFVKTLIDNAEKYHEAVNDARKAMKDAAADKAFTTLQGTVDLQLKELRAGWEAVGITVAQQFLPSMQSAVSFGNNSVIPWLLANRQLVGDLGKSVAFLGGLWITLSVGTSLLVTAGRLFTEFSTRLAVAGGSATLMDKAMSTSLSNVQRNLLATLSTTGEVTTGMETSVKMLAAQYNLSIDEIILKLRSMQTQSDMTAISVMSDDLKMATAMDGLALQTGIAAGKIKTEFAGVRTAATITSASIGRAFLSAIPVIGTVLTVGAIAMDAAGAVKQHLDDDWTKNMRTDSNFRKGEFEKSKQKEDAAYKNADEARRTGMIPGLYVKPSQKILEDYMNRQLAEGGHERQFRKDWQNGNGPMSADEAMRRNLQGTIAGAKAHADREAADALAKLNKTFVTNPHEEQNFVDPAGTKKKKSTKGVASDAQQIGLALDHLGTALNSFLKGPLEAAIKAVDGDLANDKRQISIYGITKSTYGAYDRDAHSKMAYDQAEITGLSYYRSQYKSELDAVTKHLPKDHKSTAYVEQSKKADEIQRKMDDIDQKISGLKNDRVGVMRDLADVGAERNKNQFSDFMDDQRRALRVAESKLSVASTPEALAAASEGYDRVATGIRDAIKEKLNEIKPNKDGDYTKEDQAKMRSLKDFRDGIGSSDGNRIQFQEFLSGLTSQYKTADSALSNARTPADAAAARAAYDEAVKSVGDAIAVKLESIKPNEDGEYDRNAGEVVKALKGLSETLGASDETRRQALNELRGNISSDTQDLKLRALDVYDPGLKSGVSSTLALNKKYESDYSQYVKDNASPQDFAELTNWKNLSQEIINATFALDEYNERKKKAEDSTGFKLLTSVIDTLGKTLENALENSLFGGRKTALDMQAQQSQDRISQLRAENQMISGPQYMGVRFSNELQMQQLQAQSDAAKYKADHPSLLTTVSQDIQKSFISSFVQQAETSLKSGLLQSIIGTDPSKKDQLAQQQAQQLFTQAINNGFDPSVQTFSTAAETISQAASTMASAATASSTGDFSGADMGAASFGNWGDGGGTAMGLSAKGSGGIFGGITGLLSKTLLGSGSKSVSLQGILGDAGTGSMISSLFGGANTGLGAIMGGLGGGLGTLFGGPVGGAIGSALGGLFGIFGPHYNLQKNPDIVAPQQWSSFLGNLQGDNLDPAIAAQTGGIGEGSFIEKFLQGKTTAQLQSVFGTEASSIQAAFGQYTEAGGVRNLHNGDLDISNERLNWQDINKLANDAFTQISQAANTLNQALAPIISIAAYGGKGASFSPYYTPGYGDVSSLYNLPYPMLYATNSSSATYNPSQSSGNTPTINTSVQINGREIAQAVSNVRSQQMAQGFQPDA